jgi:hypothetical protein
MRLRAALAVASFVAIGFVAPPAHALTQPVRCDAGDLAGQIDAANTNVGAETLTLAPGCVYVLTNAAGADGLPPINDQLTIVGNGATILRNSTTLFRILETNSDVTISHLTITGGHALTGATGAPGDFGGGIRNTGTLTLVGVTVAGNIAGDGGGGPGGQGGDGGGIYNSGTLTLKNSKVTSNTGGTGGVGTTFSGVGGKGGGIFNSGTLHIKGSKIRYNAAGNGGVAGGGSPGPGGAGGGIFSSGVTTLADSVITSNEAGLAGGMSAAPGIGGGIYNAGTTFTAVRSTIKGNDPDNCKPTFSVKHCKG